MSTRSVIARIDKDVFVGRYHHSDGYPSGVGKTLYTLYNGFFKRDATRMLEVLIDEHPAGWSNINGADFSKRIGYHERNHGTTDCPQCYCHGSRHEEANLINSTDIGWDIEWAYAINDKTGQMFIHTGQACRDIVAIVDLNGPEPDWEAIEARG